MAGDRLLAEDMARLAPAAQPVADAQVDLRFATHGGGRTFLAAQQVRYPFHLGRSLHFPGDPAGMPTYYVQCSAGGLFDGDRVHWRVRADAHACVHLTGSASTIVHAARDGCAVQEIDIEAGADSYVEYLPDPMILLPRARLASTVRVRVHPGASVLVWDAVVPHDHTGQGATFDWIDACMHIEDQNGRLRARDRYRLHGGLQAQHLPGVTGRFACQAGFAVVSAAQPLPQLQQALRTALAELPSAYAAISALPAGAGLWLRCLAEDAHALRAALYSAWCAVRTALIGAPPSPRRK